MAVTFTACGRMGNFLFMAANMIAYSLRHNLEFSAPQYTSHDYWSPLYLQHLVNKNFDRSAPTIVVTEKNFHYDEIPFDESWRDRNIMLSGYFQSEKYFQDYKNEVIKLFAFPWQMQKDFISVHVRRGDYLTLKMKHPPVTKEWYESAMSMFPNKKFKFFSDDIAWCKENFGQRTDCIFSEGKTIEQDLIEMSWCEHNISSASTYGYWGSYLNQNPDKKIILPKLWFMPRWDNADTKDIVPSTWIKL